MQIKYRDICALFGVLFYLAIVAGGQAAVSANANLDSLAIERLAQDGETSGGSYAAMALLYLLIPAGLHQGLTLMVGLAALAAGRSRRRRAPAPRSH